MGILQCIGNTPITTIDINPNPKVQVSAKLEGNSPGGSIKDSIALYMIETAEREKRLTRDKIILEATSGNTGIGLAMVASAKRYRVKLTMPACVSIERRRVLEAFGAELILSPPDEATDAAIRLAHRILSEDPEKYFMPNQFDNAANVLAHYETTGREIIEQTGGRITHFVAGMGTTGTLMGVSKRLKEFNKEIKIIGIEPVLHHRIQGLKNMSEFEILDIVPEIRSPENATVLAALSGKVEFQDVCFRYSDENAIALHDVNLTVQPNQIIALIGPTGSGKTSLINLIPRFYDVSEGAVLVDGIDVRSVELVSLRKQVGIVLQTSLLFSDSIRENIAYGRPGASMDEVVVASKAAAAHDFILEFPDGYETIIGERGVTLSGGQRQRVAIARALLMDPRILILDDSTSSVDTRTERMIQEALTRLMEGRTTFVIAHRLSTVRRADLILVMDKGRIAERGTHHELIAQDSLYREIYDLQLRDQERFQAEIGALEGPPGQPERRRIEERLGRLE